MALFDKAYWKDEIATFNTWWNDPFLPPDRASLLLRGLTLLVSCTTKHHPKDPDFRDEVASFLRDKLFEARKRFGGPWFASNMIVFNNHDLPCGQEGAECPCAALKITPT